MQIQEYSSGFKFPTGMNFLGPDDILVVEKNTGKVKEIKNGTVVGTVLDVNVANVSERGLLGIAVASEPKYVFLFYTETENTDGGNVLGNRLYRYEYDDGKLVNPKLLLDLPTIPGPSHNGGVLKIGPDNKSVYLVIGNLNYVQNLTFITKAQNNKDGPPPDGRGGVLRITFDGGVVEDKGLLGDEDPLNKYYAYGIRNSFGIGFDAVTGNLWETENGRSTDDEINLVLPGFNSGWREVIGFSNETDEFNEENLETFGGKGTYRDPEFIWRDTIAPTSVLFIHTDNLGPKYKDNLFVGSVKNGTIFNFPLDETRMHLVLTGPLADKTADNNQETGSVTFGRNFGVITDLQIGPDGNLYVLSNYKHDGTIFKISAKTNTN
ncbi:MAG: PQQ-dependent sugar dehydrogenase [Nitrososphaeraceae archaeon]|nr:PQQ-dependent sugar dehydrogenase [Nitrososphaeraceae archaeon]MDW0135642.1 PQQ-dependent sugar dehydrogenase [Nitrososphaeraceae archaeon]